MMLSACSENPVENDSIPLEFTQNKGSIAKVEIWNTDIRTARKTNLLEETLYNNTGDIVRNTVYNPETGDLSKEAVFTYNDNTSVEIQRIIDPMGKELEFRNEYIYNNSGQIETKKSYDYSGEVISIEDFDYDVNGNILNSTKESQSKKHTFKYLYTFDDMGLVATREIQSESTVISRDSMYRNQEASTLTIYSFAEDNQFVNAVVYRYNNRGDITSERVLGKNGEILERKLYQYLYHRK